MRESNPQLFGGAAKESRHRAQNWKSPVSFDADDQKLFTQVLAYYRQRLLQSRPAQRYLESRGISREAIQTFGLGLADRTLGFASAPRQIARTGRSSANT